MLRKSLPLLYTMAGLITLAIVVSLGQPPVAKLPDPEVEPERPESLAEKLGSRDYATREAAMKSLRQMGLAALPAIREALKSDNPEVQRRASELLGQMEYLEKLEPTRVTLQGDGLYLTDALEELTKQTHFHHDIGDQDILPQKHNLNLQNVTYWEAMDHLAIKWNQGITVDRQDRGYSLSRENKRSTYVSNSGPFQIELQGVQGARDLRFVDIRRDPASLAGKLWLDFIIRAEPRLVILGHEPVMWENAIPQTGRGFEFGLEQSFRFAMSNFRRDIPGHSYIFTQELPGNWKHASTVEPLKGYLPIRVVVKQTAVLLTEDIPGSEGKKFQFGDEHFELCEIRCKEKTVEFHLKTSNRNLATTLRKNRLTLVDRKGHQLDELVSPGSSSSSDGERETFEQYYFYPRFDPQRAEPLSLMFMEWKVVRYLVPFTFHNVPLP